MDAQDLVPEIFSTLIEQRKKAESVTPAILSRYCSRLKDQPTFINELVEVIGEDNFLILIQRFGGIKLDIPQPGDIITEVNKYE